MREMAEDEISHARGTAAKAEPAGQFVADKAEIGRLARGENGFDQGERRSRPTLPVSAAGDSVGQAAACCEPAGAEVVKLCATDVEVCAGCGGGEFAVVEEGESLGNDRSWKSVEKLFLFIRETLAGASRETSTDWALPQTPEFYEWGRMAPGGSSPPGARYP